MKLTCPSCGAEMDADVLAAHEESRQALALLMAVGLPLGKQVMQYLRLFKPAKRQLGIGRVVSLVEQLRPDMLRGAIARNGRDWAAPREAWATAFDKLLEARDAGKLTLPLKTHGYLYEVIAGLADKAEGQAEREREAERRARAQASAAAGAVKLQAGDALSAAVATVTPPPAYSAGPSRAARELQAQIAAHKARKEAPPTEEPQP